MITEDQITAALDLLDEASPGPARWTNPCTGVDGDGEPHHPVRVFAQMLALDRIDGRTDRDSDLIDSAETIAVECHGVSVPDPEHGSHTIADIEAGGAHQIVAITGNGPRSRANARAIAASMDREVGWRAALLEVRWLRAALEHQTEAAAERRVEQMTEERDVRRAHDELREEVFSAIEGGFGIMTATPGRTIREEGIRCRNRIRELRRELVRVHGALGDIRGRMQRDNTGSVTGTVYDAVITELANLERTELRLTDWGDGVVSDEPGMTILTEASRVDASEGA